MYTKNSQCLPSIAGELSKGVERLQNSALQPGGSGAASEHCLLLYAEVHGHHV